MNTAKEFRRIWQQQNPNIIHIPSEHELGLMQAYAEYYHEQQINLSLGNVSDIFNSEDMLESFSAGNSYASMPESDWNILKKDFNKWITNYR